MHNHVILSTILSWTLVLSTTAWAGYVPPAKQEPPSDYSRSTGVRSGCFAQSDNYPLVILAPQTYVGETSSSRPQFTWFVKAPSEIDFRLFEFTANGQVKQKGNAIQLKSSAGINRLSLPSEQPPLTVGQKYLWQVAIKCPDGNFVLERAEFRVVARPSNFDANLNNSGQVEYYAQKGFWYDALTESLQEAESGKLGESGSSLVSSLAQSESSTQQNRETIERRIASLEAIAENLR